MTKNESMESIALPIPNSTGQHSLETVLRHRRSVREFSDEPVTQAQIGQLLWATQGITHARGFRTAPSAGAVYPLEVYVVMESGMYHYEPEKHGLGRTQQADLRPLLHRAALAQSAVNEAPVVVVIAGVYPRMAREYGDVRARRYVHLEAGHAAQNLHLQATALGLGSVPIAAFDDERVGQVLRLKSSESPLYLIPVGHPDA